MWTSLAVARAERPLVMSQRRSKRFLCTPEDVARARAFVDDCLRRLDATDDQRHRFRLAVSELAANVVTHGASHGATTAWSVGVAATPDWLLMDVSGGTAPADNVIFRPDEWVIADADRPSGRGLGIVRRVMDGVAVETRRRQIRVTCRVRRPTAAH